MPLLTILCCAFGYGAERLRFAGDYRIFFGPDNPDFVANEDAQATFGKPDNIAFVLTTDEGSIYSQSTIAAIHDLTEASWSLPYASRVDSLTNFQNSVGENDDLFVEDLVPDPSALSPAEIVRLQALAEREPLIHGFLTARDGAAAVVNVTVQLPTDVPNITSTTVVAARELRAQIQRDYPGLRVHITGVAALSAAFEEAGLRDSSTLIPAVYALILVVLLIVLRSLVAMASSLLLILLATFVGVGVGGFSGVELTPISLAAPTVILTIAIADAIHILAGVRSRMWEGMERKMALIETTAVNFAPISITSLTTVVGFLTLNLSDSPPFHHLGNMSAAGIAAAWFLSITFLPAILAWLPLRFRARNRASDASRGLLAVVEEIVVEQPGRVACLVAFCCAVLIALIPTMEINDQWSNYFDERLEFRQAIDTADRYFGSDNVEFIVDPGESGAVTRPDFLATLDSFTTWLRGQEDAVAHVFSLSDVMKRLNKNLHSDDPAFYAIPESQTLASQYLLVYELSLPYGLDLSNRVDIDRRSTRITASMKDISTGETRAFLEEARAWFSSNGGGYELEVTGSKVLFAFVAERNIEALFEGAIALVLAIFAILSMSLRSLSIGLLSLIPNALPMLAAFGLWALLVGVVGFSVAAVGSVAVGVIVDDTVHFLSKYLRARERGDSVEASVRYSFETAGTAILLTTVILAAGFALLASSSFKLNADLGLLTALAVGLAMAVNFTLLPSMLLLIDRLRTRFSTAPAAPPERNLP
ncbi:MAG: MMPL family transporter [Acidobacteriota bacterium]